MFQLIKWQNLSWENRLDCDYYCIRSIRWRQVWAFSVRFADFSVHPVDIYRPPCGHLASALRTLASTLWTFSPTLWAFSVRFADF